MQFTFEIRCRGEHNVTGHVAVGFVVVVVPMGSLFTAMGSQEKSVQVKGELFLSFR